MSEATIRTMRPTDQTASRTSGAGRRHPRQLPTRASAELKAILEALIFASPDPLTPQGASTSCSTPSRRKTSRRRWPTLKQDYERPGGLQLVEVAGGYQIVTRPDLHEWVRRLFHERSDAEADGAGARDAGRHRLPAADHGARDHRDSRRQHVRRAEHAARAAPDQDRRPQAGRRPAVHVRDDQGIPDSLRAERSERSAEGRRHGRSARHRARRCSSSRRHRGACCRSRSPTGAGRPTDDETPPTGSTPAARSTRPS